MTDVPFNDLYAQYKSIQTEIDDAISSVIRSSSFIRGAHVDEFEEKFANKIGAKSCVSCANGTDALYIAMISLGIKAGDEVIVPAMSWISTSETVTQAGGKVVFCDIDPISNTIDTEKLACLVTDRTVGIIPVHLYGHPANMKKIMQIAKSNSLWVIEDCAQAHLAEYEGQIVGTFGNAATFSFYPGKNLGAMGDAGAIITNDIDLAANMAKFARHGGLRKGDHEIEGINSRLDGIQAAILNVKLPHLKDWTDKRRYFAKRYNKLLNRSNTLLLPDEGASAKHVWHIYQIQTNDRDSLQAFLNKRGIQTSINYPCALPFLPCYSERGHTAQMFPNAVSLSHKTLTLPLFPDMTELQHDMVVESIYEWEEK